MNVRKLDREAPAWADVAVSMRRIRDEIAHSVEELVADLDRAGRRPRR